MLEAFRLEADKVEAKLKNEYMENRNMFIEKQWHYNEKMICYSQKFLSLQVF